MRTLKSSSTSETSHQLATRHKDPRRAGLIIKYDLYSAVSTIWAKRNSCSGVRAERGAFGSAKSSSIEASESGEATCDWFSGVIFTESKAACNLGRRSARYRTKVSTDRWRSSEGDNMSESKTWNRGVTDTPCNVGFFFELIDAVSSSWWPPGKNIPSPVLRNLPPTEPELPETRVSNTSVAIRSWTWPVGLLSLSRGDSEAVWSSSTGTGPPYSGIHFSWGTESRPETASGYKATTLAGLKSSSINASMAASKFEARNCETAFNARIRILRCSWCQVSRQTALYNVKLCWPCLEVVIHL